MHSCTSKLCCNTPGKSLQAHSAESSKACVGVCVCVYVVNITKSVCVYTYVHMYV